MLSLFSSSLSSRSYENEVGPMRMRKPGLSRERKRTMLLFQTVVASASANHRGALNVLLMLV